MSAIGARTDGMGLLPISIADAGVHALGHMLWPKELCRYGALFTLSMLINSPNSCALITCRADSRRSLDRSARREVR
eukprot:6581916-Pyramimonas_sp.AAC.1